jgi:ABC-2 type transport system permease protein
VEGASAFSYPLIFLPMLSSAFVPTETMPKILRVFAENQPAASIVETIRGLLGGGAVGNEIWVALAWCIGITIAAYLFAMRAYNRQVG